MFVILSAAPHAEERRPARLEARTADAATCLDLCSSFARSFAGMKKLVAGRAANYDGSGSEGHNCRPTPRVRQTGRNDRTAKDFARRIFCRNPILNRLAGAGTGRIVHGLRDYLKTLVIMRPMRF